ncbi:hypothetical protein FIC87_11215 [Eggerthella lenta]|uniref:Uncharacterized protein n=1 Tax=Eggerthella lenta TaxID=84112 RepID=A0A5C5BT40_EGGLN|nr:hypothetical protein [Eggerthella lenta]TNU89455.1 hypothetical protein FIC87_11215 [Eggerthella lenta]
MAKLTKHEKRILDKKKSILIYEEADSLSAYLDSGFFPSGSRELEEAAKNVFLPNPCDEETERKLRRTFGNLPIFYDGAEPEDAIFFKTLPPVAAETLTEVPDGTDDAPANGYVFPAGMVLNLALDAMAEKLGTELKLWQLGETELRALYDGSEDRLAALTGIAELMRAALFQGWTLTADALNDWFDEIPFSPSSPSVSGRYRQLANTQASIASKWEAELEHHARTLAQAGPDERDAKPKAANPKRSKQLRCLMDAVFYSLRAFAVKDNRSNAFICPSCHRPFFKDHGREKYCLFRSPDPDYPSDSCREAVTKICAKKSSQASNLKKKIERLLEQRYDRRTYPNQDLLAFQDAYASEKKRLHETVEAPNGYDARLKRYDLQIQWLEEERAKLLGTKADGKEAGAE